MCWKNVLECSKLEHCVPEFFWNTVKNFCLLQTYTSLWALPNTSQADVFAISRVFLAGTAVEHECSFGTLFAPNLCLQIIKITFYDGVLCVIFVFVDLCAHDVKYFVLIQSVLTRFRYSPPIFTRLSRFRFRCSSPMTLALSFAMLSDNVPLHVSLSHLFSPWLRVSRPLLFSRFRF